VGALLLVGLATDAIGHRTRLPRVTLLLLFGTAVGPAGLDLLTEATQWLPFITHVSLAMVGFLLGDSLSAKNLREHGKEVLALSLGAVVATAMIVSGGALVFGQSLAVALVLGGLATSTAPAATADVVREADTDSPFSRTLLGVVALDDAFGLVLFSLMFAAAREVNGVGGGGPALVHHLREVGGALLLGGALGIPVAMLSGRVAEGEPTLAEALGSVLLCAGLALWLEVSYLIACMTLGAVVSNFARHHTRPFRAIENVEWPFMTLFFVLAGASLQVQGLMMISGLLTCYVVLRMLGRLAGCMLGGAIVGWPRARRGWFGLALMPQAGVALGMALVASDRMPELASVVLPVVIASTVFFELIGPVLTRTALERAA